LILSGAALVVAVGIVALAPGAVHLELGNSKSADKATSGRYDLIKGGLKLFKRAPLVGQGSGSFAREYRRAEHVSPERAASASHTIPVTVAAEQGVVGLAAYAWLLWSAFELVFGGLRRTLRRRPAGVVLVARCVVAAAFCALLLHTLVYAAFLEDPLTWTLLAMAAALRRVEPEADARVSRSDSAAQAVPT
jgi:O-antigen ligase